MSATLATGVAEIDGGRIAYRVDGAEGAPTLVFVNSLGTDLRMWNPQVGPLARRFRVLRYDCRGHGGSDVPDGPLTIARLGRDLVALLDHLEAERAHVCGLSLGGLAAMWVAAHHADRVERAVLANTAARIGSAEGWQARIDAVRAGGVAAVRDTVVARFLGQPFRRAHPEVTRRITEMIESTPPDGYIAACAALRDADLRELVASIRAPTLIVAGELDESTPARQGEELHAAIAGSELVVLTGTAHLSNVERPEEFTRIVSQFLSA